MSMRTQHLFNALRITVGQWARFGVEMAQHRIPQRNHAMELALILECAGLYTHRDKYLPIGERREAERHRPRQRPWQRRQSHAGSAGPRTTVPHPSGRTQHRHLRRRRLNCTDRHRGPKVSVRDHAMPRTDPPHHMQHVGNPTH